LRACGNTWSINFEKKMPKKPFFSCEWSYERGLMIYEHFSSSPTAYPPKPKDRSG
jgi:hypothetical protein